MCWDWARIFHNALLAADLKCVTFKEVKFWYRGREHRNDPVHYWEEIHVCGNPDRKCIVRIDDGFFSNSDFVNGADWPLSRGGDAENIHDVDDDDPDMKSKSRIQEGDEPW